MNNPCYGCDMRAVGCHGSCTLYSEWRSEHVEKMKAINKDRNQESAYRQFKIEMVTKENRRHGRKC